MQTSASASMARNRRLTAAAFVVVMLAAVMAACSGTAAPSVAVPTIPPAAASALASALGGLPGLASGLPGLPGGFPSGLLPPGSEGPFCKLLSADEIQSAASDTIIHTDGDDRNCTWTMSRLDTINVRIEEDTTSDFIAQKLLSPDARDVPGLGDKSIWGPGLTILWTAAKGKTYAVQLVLFPADDAKNLALATSLMQKLLSRV